MRGCFGELIIGIFVLILDMLLFCVFRFNCFFSVDYSFFIYGFIINFKLIVLLV